MKYFIISSLYYNKIIKHFIQENFIPFESYHAGRDKLKEAEGWIKGNETFLQENEKNLLDKQTILADCLLGGEMSEECIKIKKEGTLKLEEANKKYNTNYESIESVIEHAKNILNENKKYFSSKSEELEQGRLEVIGINKKYIWPFLNALFVSGGMIGALTSKYILDYLGRKNGVLFNCFFGLIASVVVFIGPYLKSPVCLMISRLLFGIQGGMACSIV
jgi:hypothetical protein